MHTVELRIDSKLRLALVFCTYSKNYLPSVLRLPSPANSLAPSDEGAGVRWTPLQSRNPCLPLTREVARRSRDGGREELTVITVYRLLSIYHPPHLISNI